MLNPEIREKYEVVIGLEVHCQLLTNSKIFASDTVEFGSMPNTNVSVITLGHPGTLPKLNKKAVEHAIKMGLACGCHITRHSVFARKNYFYPDLPKGYQISQDKTSICLGGTIHIKTKDGVEKSIGLTRIHLEEDAGKSIHLAGEADTLVDFNRAGTALIEIVSEPEIRSSDEAYAYLTEVRKLVRYLEICDGNMEEGSLRCDANISVMPKGSPVFGTKVEVKNMNSINNVKRAIEYEIERQILEVEQGKAIQLETRLFNANNGQTYSMRVKETMNDYRYFPEPDLTPLVISEEWLTSIRQSLPSLPQELFEKFTSKYGIPEYDALVLTDNKEIALYFDALCHYTTNYKSASNWIMGSVKSYLNESGLTVSQFPILPEQLAGLISLVDSNKVSNSVASQKIFPAMLKQPSLSALAIAESQNLMQESDTNSLQTLINEILASHPQKVTEYKKGKKGLLGMFMGEVMKKTGGKADPKLTNELLSKSLNT
ncbi:Asp-tRNA(Asn)/Glu-tRNA(Gln) amidotransferase subunit GatB [Rhodocytophaga aerolata]|uniref:Aspartyl/glutamyl-tRNA(Asn/Gln) amidotransferase subunit B n=1 Tax=Rhodocytophaga aerolata TaxID=455078 RepID=A0ABT8R311_9BACT|nr:Asp-tRNA(Asn)/Glu-tRNA(Gln) amidotransferase subunit GatB [Rhodocytophaga aerolata]MDO1445152.1 Asp-tRNA(Asn)/Glu-tRNA(Gln) amidotransferase subunit GatB [Rhodocytophaga aerolata]